LVIFAEKLKSMMIKKSLFRIILIIFFGLALYPVDGLSQESWREEIRRQRQQKDSMFRHADKSPLIGEQVQHFGGLDYFRLDKKYVAQASIVRSKDTTSFIIPTTTDREPLYRKYGRATFVIDGDTLQLTIYQNIDLMNQRYEDYLFIPFNDLTNGMETYGGGRYLDVQQGEGDTLTLDFNKAYNPYCAYNPKYSCPIPPDENKLDVEIRAGEKNFDK